MRGVMRPITLSAMDVSRPAPLRFYPFGLSQAAAPDIRVLRPPQRQRGASVGEPKPKHAERRPLISNLVKTIVQDFGWIHLSLGLMGNTAFFVGSILFLPAFEPLKTLGVWLFIIGSFGMLVGAVGRLLVDLFERQEESD